MRTEQQLIECYISVDVETSGPVPSAFSLLSIGACIIKTEGNDFTPKSIPSTFYRTLKPLDEAGSDPEALRVTGLSLDELIRTGDTPEEAMRAFEQWITTSAEGVAPVFVGLNAAFDWSFINYYFYRFLGRNPFGFTALDIKSLYMGIAGCAWRETKSSLMSETLGAPRKKPAHQALDDAQAQAELFALIYERSRHQL